MDHKAASAIMASPASIPHQSQLLPDQQNQSEPEALQPPQIHDAIVPVQSAALHQQRDDADERSKRAVEHRQQLVTALLRHKLHAATLERHYIRHQQGHHLSTHQQRPSRHDYNQTTSQSSPDFDDEPAPSAYVLPDNEQHLLLKMSVPDFASQSGSASILFITETEPNFTIDGADKDKIDQCAILAAHFEAMSDGRFKASVEITSRLVAVAFLRHLHTGTYLTNDDDGIAVVPPSFAFHVDMYTLADNFHCPTLKVEASTNICRVLEFSCSTANKPADLCVGIASAYTSLPDDQALRSNIVNYCVTNFLYHKLMDDIHLVKLVDEFPQFGVDLCVLNYERRFKDEGAAGIIEISHQASMAVPAVDPVTLAKLRQFVYDTWGPGTFKSRCGSGFDSVSSSGSFTLVRRPGMTSSNGTGHSTPSVTASENERDGGWAWLYQSAASSELPFRGKQPVKAMSPCKYQLTDNDAWPDMDAKDFASSDEDPFPRKAPRTAGVSHDVLPSLSRHGSSSTVRQGDMSPAEPETGEAAESVHMSSVRQGKMRATDSETEEPSYATLGSIVAQLRLEKSASSGDAARPTAVNAELDKEEDASVNDDLSRGTILTRRNPVEEQQADEDDAKSAFEEITDSDSEFEFV